MRGNETEGDHDADRRGCGPLIPPLSESMRPLRQQIFERVRAAGLMSRVEIAKELAVSPASVTTSTSELIRLGHLEEVRLARAAGDVGRGRPPIALGVRAGAHHVAGIKLSDREHTAVVVDFAGHLLASHTVPATPGPVAMADLAASADRLLRGVCAAAGVPRTALSAVGMGVPGFVNHFRGAVYWSPLLDGDGTAFARDMSRALGVEVTIDNDANLVALAELWFGVGREIADFAVVTIEHGLGMGLVLNHRIYRGSSGLGLELGHTKVHLDGALCRCGQRGCLEAYVADYAIAREATVALERMHAAPGATPALLQALYDEAKAGNPAARSIFHRAGRYLAVGLANVVNLFEPALIILSGARMKFDYLYATDSLAAMDQLVLPTGLPAPRIEVHAWGDMLWAHGAAALALSSVTQDSLAPARETAAQ